MELTELNLRLANATTGPLDVTVQESNQSGTPALSYYQFNPAWAAKCRHCRPLAAQAGLNDNKRVRRAALVRFLHGDVPVGRSWRWPRRFNSVNSIP